MSQATSRSFREHLRQADLSMLAPRVITARVITARVITARVITARVITVRVITARVVTARVSVVLSGSFTSQIETGSTLNSNLSPRFSGH